MKNPFKIFFQLFIFLFLQLLPLFSNSQVTFQKSYSSTYDQSGVDALPTSDGGYIIAGMTTNNILNDMDIYVMKTNNMGVPVWTKSYGGNKPEYPNSMVETSDGNYFIVGYSQSYGGGDYDIYLIKIKPNGDTLWTKTYGDYGNDQGNEIIPTTDGNYMIIGTSNGLATSDYNAVLLKIDIDGKEKWKKNYGGTGYESGQSAKESLDGGFILLGQTYSYGQGGGDAYLVKTNAAGDEEWTKTYGGTQNDEGVSVLANNDGSYVLCVRDSSSGAGDVDVQVIKTDASGTVIWNKTYGGNKKDTDKMIQPTTDGGYVIAAHSRSFGWINPDFWIVKINAVGDTTWTRHYGGYDHEHCYAVRQTSDGGFIAIGHSESFSTYTQIMFLKLNPIGNLGPLSVDEFSLNDVVSIFPNPAKDIINVSFKDVGDFPEDFGSIQISDVLGRIVFSEINFSFKKNNDAIIDLKRYDRGIYFLSIQFGNDVITKKLVLK